jgi:hypothetical protein
MPCGSAEASTTCSFPDSQTRLSFSNIPENNIIKNGSRSPTLNLMASMKFDKGFGSPRSAIFRSVVSTLLFVLLAYFLLWLPTFHLVGALGGLSSRQHQPLVIEPGEEYVLSLLLRERGFQCSKTSVEHLNGRKYANANQCNQAFCRKSRLWHLPVRHLSRTLAHEPKSLAVLQRSSNVTGSS